MLLEKEVADAVLGPVGTRAGSSLEVENFYPMAALEAWKAASSSGDHENGQQALRKGLKGAMMLHS